MRTRDYYEIEQDLYDAYKANFITDSISENLQVQNRVDEFYDYVITKISRELAASITNPIAFTSAEIIQENSRIDREYPLGKYTKSISVFRNDPSHVIDENLREVKQLRKVFSDDSRILEELINEVFYKDFKSFYLDLNMDREIDSIEDRAFHNYLYSLDEIETSPNMSPKLLFVKTMNKPLEDELFEFSDSIYCRRGCYIFLTSDKVEEHRQITWELQENDG